MTYMLSLFILNTIGCILAVCLSEVIHTISQIRPATKGDIKLFMEGVT